MPGRAGDRGGLAVDGEVVDGEAAGDGPPQRRRFDHCQVAAGLEACAQLAGAVGGIAEDGYPPVLAGEQAGRDSGLVVARAAAAGERDGGE